MESSPASPVAALENAVVGETVVLRCILFDGIRSRFQAAGIAEGVRIRLLTRTPHEIVLETRDGRRVRLERDEARFVQVSRRPYRYAGRTRGLLA